MDWYETRRPHAAWAERPGFDSSIAFLEQSRKARDAALEAEKDRQRRELRRTRHVAAVVGAAFLLAVGFVGYALYEQRRAAREQDARMQADTLREAQLGEARAALPRTRMTCSAASVDRLVAPPFSPTANQSGPIIGLNGRPGMM